MNIRRLTAPLLVTAAVLYTGAVFAQGAFPAPLPGQTVQKNDSAFPPVNQKNDPAFPPVNGSAPVASVGAPSSFPVQGASPVTGADFERAGPPPMGQAAPSDACMKAFMPLREEAERRGKLIQAAGARHAPPDEACKLIGSFAQAELKMINYVESNGTKCGIPPEIAAQLRKGHKGTEGMQKKVCAVAEQQQMRGAAGPSLSEVLGSSASLPEARPAKKGGSTFDTLNGNVLTR